MGSMIMRKAHELDVSLSRENSHIFYTTCSNGSMGGDMATTATCLFSSGVGHEIDIHPLYNHGQVFGLVLLFISAIYYSLVDVTFVVHYLPCYFLQLQWMRLHCDHMRHCLHFMHMV